MLSRTGCRPCLMASVSVNSGRTRKEGLHSRRQTIGHLPSGVTVQQCANECSMSSIATHPLSLYREAMCCLMSASSSFSTLQQQAASKRHNHLHCLHVRHGVDLYQQLLGMV